MALIPIMGKGLDVNRIREIRNEKKMSLEKVAEACVPPTTAKQIHLLEKGERRLTVDWVVRLSAAFGVPPSDIAPPLEGEDWAAALLPKLRRVREDKQKLIEDLVREMSDE